MDIHEKSVDMDMDMDGKFHIYGKPAKYSDRRKQIDSTLPYTRLCNYYRSKIFVYLSFFLFLFVFHPVSYCPFPRFFTQNYY